MLAFNPVEPCRVCDNCFVILEQKARRDMHVTRPNDEEQETADLPLLDDSLLTLSNRPLYVGVSTYVIWICVSFFAISTDFIRG